jgi:hypothetical protein
LKAVSLFFSTHKTGYVTLSFDLVSGTKMRGRGGGRERGLRDAERVRERKREAERA